MRVIFLRCGVCVLQLTPEELDWVGPITLKDKDYTFSPEQVYKLGELWKGSVYTHGASHDYYRPAEVLALEPPPGATFLDAQAAYPGGRPEAPALLPAGPEDEDGEEPPALQAPG